MLDDLSDDVKNVFLESLEELKKAGVEVKEIEFPELKLSLPVYYTLMPAELSSNLARYDGIRYGNTKQGKDLLDTYLETKEQGFGEEIKRRIILGTYILSAGYAGDFYAKALALREDLKNKFKEKIEEVDGIVLPTFPTIAPKIGEVTNPIDEYLADIYTVSANIIGCPAISIPSKGEVEGLPIGLQIISDFGNDKELLKLAKKF
jgi:aspartyl-tRNA(Asn)/glutamyl-tRNA(Gln) amidotransferase subunit A